MRMFWQTEDKAIDNLLRVRRITDAACRGFDPDLAAAYVERSLTSTDVARYEIHLAECAGCRKTTVALMRAVEADKPHAVKRIEKTGWADALKNSVIALATPRTALAVTAVLVLAASFAFVILRQPQASDTEQARASESRQTTESLLAPQPESVAPAPEQDANEQSARPLLAKAGRANNEQETALADEKKDAASEPPAPTVAQPTAKAVEENAAAKTEEMARKSESEKPASAPPRPPTEDKPLPRIEGGRSMPSDDSDARSRVSTLRPGVVDGEATEGGKEKKVIRPDDTVARGEAASTSGTAGRIAAPPASSRLRDSKDEAKSRAKGTPEIKIGGKRFYFLNETWTDKDYKPEKEMPVVPVVRGSALYKELLTKNAGLKVYFESERFAEERAIIVYKNTVYKLSPPEK